MALCEINQKIAPTPSVILPLDESESSVPNIFVLLCAVMCQKKLDCSILSVHNLELSIRS
jgi:hypothetical protein